MRLDRVRLVERVQEIALILAGVHALEQPYAAGGAFILA